MTCRCGVQTAGLICPNCARRWQDRIVKKGNKGSNPEKPRR